MQKKNLSDMKLLDYIITVPKRLLRKLIMIHSMDEFFKYIHFITSKSKALYTKYIPRKI